MSPIRSAPYSDELRFVFHDAIDRLDSVGYGDPRPSRRSIRSLGYSSHLRHVNLTSPFCLLLDRMATTPAVVHEHIVDEEELLALRELAEIDVEETDSTDRAMSADLMTLLRKVADLDDTGRARVLAAHGERHGEGWRPSRRPRSGWKGRWLGCA